MFQASVISKQTHIAAKIENINEYELNTPSVVKLNIQVENVNKISILNGDLFIVMKDGQVIRIENFKAENHNLDNSLVLLNGESLVWVTFGKDGIYEVNPKYDYLGLKSIEDLLYKYEHEESSNLMPWIVAGGAVVAGAVGLASGGSSGSDGKSGQDGQDGRDGQDVIQQIYEYASANGFNGTQNEILELILSQGADGKSAYDLAVEKGFNGTVDSWLASLQGAKGSDGKSAYEIAKSYGFEGTEKEWLESLTSKGGESIIILPSPIITAKDDVSFTGTAQPGSTLNLYNSKGLIIASTMVDENGIWAIPNLLDKNEVGMLIVVDGKGSTSLPLPVVDIALPAFPEVSPGSQYTTKPVVTEADIYLKGTSEAGAKIQVLLNGNLKAETIADQDGNWSFLPNPLPQGMFGGVLAHAVGKLPSTEVIVNGFIPHSTPEPVVEFDGKTLSGCGPIGAVIKVYDQNQNFIVGTSVDSDGKWSFEGNPIAKGDYGYVTATEPYKDESSLVYASGEVIPQLDAPVVTYNNEDGLSGEALKGSKIYISVGSEVFETTTDENGHWSFEPNPILNQGYGYLNATLSDFKPSYYQTITPADNIAPKFDVELSIGHANLTLHSLNQMNYINVIQTHKSGYSTSYTDTVVNGKWSYNTNSSLEFDRIQIFAVDNFGNASEMMDITEILQTFNILKSVENYGLSGTGFANSEILVTQDDTGAHFKVKTNDTGYWSITEAELNEAGVLLNNQNLKYSAHYETFNNKDVNITGSLTAEAPLTVKPIVFELIYNSLDSYIIQTEPFQKITIDGASASGYYQFYADEKGLIKLDHKNADLKITTYDQNNDVAVTLNVPTYQIVVDSNELLLTIYGARNAEYEIATKDGAVRIHTDANGVYRQIPNPYSKIMFTVDRVIENHLDIEPQEFGVVVKEPNVIAQLGGVLLFDVPVYDYKLNIYDKNGNLVISQNTSDFGSSFTLPHLLKDTDAIYGGLKWGVGEISLTESIVHGEKYYIEYVNLVSGGVSQKVEFEIGSGVDAVPYYATNIVYLSNKMIFADQGSEISAYDIDGNLIFEGTVSQLGYLDIGNYNFLYSVKFVVSKDGELVQVIDKTITSLKPEVVVQGNDNEYIWGYAENATHVILIPRETYNTYSGTFGYTSQKFIAELDESGKFVINTNIHDSIRTLDSFYIQAINVNNASVSPDQYAFTSEYRGIDFNAGYVQIDQDAHELKILFAGSMRLSSIKIVDFYSGVVVAEQGWNETDSFKMDLSKLDSGLYRMFGNLSQEVQYMQLYINDEGKIFITNETPTTGFDNEIFEILNYADDLGGNTTYHHDYAKNNDFHFNLNELIYHDFDGDKDIHDFLSTIVTNNQDGTSSTSVLIDRDGAGDKFHAKEIIVLDNAGFSIDELLLNGTIVI